MCSSVKFYIQIYPHRSPHRSRFRTCLAPERFPVHPVSHLIPPPSKITALLTSDLTQHLGLVLPVFELQVSGIIRSVFLCDWLLSLCEIDATVCCCVVFDCRNIQQFIYHFTVDGQFVSIIQWLLQIKLWWTHLFLNYWITEPMCIFRTH